VIQNYRVFLLGEVRGGEPHAETHFASRCETLTPQPLTPRQTENRYANPRSGAPGVWEISLEPLAPVQAEDSLIYCEETIKNIARQHGLGATFYPKPFEKLTGIGIHHHLSISQKQHEDAFLAGLLEHWKSLAAFFMPNYDSNVRNFPGEWVTWGERNKSAPIRKVRPCHWELRSIDGSKCQILGALLPLLNCFGGYSASKQLPRHVYLLLKVIERHMLTPRF